MFVNYWDTACNSHTPWWKVVQMWWNNTATSVYYKYRRNLQNKSGSRIILRTSRAVLVHRARKCVIKIIYWPYQLLLWKQRNSERRSFQSVPSILYESDVNMWKIWDMCTNNKQAPCNMSFGGWGGAAHIHNILSRARQAPDGHQTTTGKDTEW